jgi:hypothetical protein
MIRGHAATQRDNATVHVNHQLVRVDQAVLLKEQPNAAQQVRICRGDDW